MSTVVDTDLLLVNRASVSYQAASSSLKSYAAGDAGGRGIAKAAAYIKVTSGVPAIERGRNTSSITDLGVGNYFVAFTNSAPSDNFCVVGTGKFVGDTGGDRQYETLFVPRSTGVYVRGHRPDSTTTRASEAIDLEYVTVLAFW